MPQPSANDTDGDIIRDVLAGQPDRFAALVVRYQSALLRGATGRLGRREWAEDVVQEAFLWAFKCLHSYDSQYSFRTWLWTILWNQCNRHFQKRDRRPRVSFESDGSVADEFRGIMETLPDSMATPSAKLSAKERSDMLEALLKRMPDSQANALRLRFYGDLKFHEIADVMGCSVSGAKHRVRIGLLKLAQEIEQSELAWDLSTGDLK